VRELEDEDADRTRDRLLMEHGLAFFGRIVASTTHEINNVLSIVDQSSGLIEDLLLAARSGRPLDPERVGETVARIQSQSSRGLDIVRRLNKFAHSADKGVAAFELNETLANLVSLIRRLADLKKVELELRPSPGSVEVAGSPYLAQELLFGAYVKILEQAEAGDSIVIHAIGGEGNHRTVLSLSRDGTAPGAADDPALQALAELLSGKVSEEQGDGETRIEISLPAKGAAG
jgi:phosphoglycerate-specific signal transduction histidine kinase